jgi:hypothetical protein
MRRFSLALIALLLVTSAASAQSVDDRTAVRQAALDYVEALYEVDTTRIARSVHPDLMKYGYYRADGTYRGGAMTYDELEALVLRWNRDPQRVDPATAVKEVVVFDVLDKTASAKVVAHWGVDYMHLAKVDGQWMIRNILWQSPPLSE